jgi:L-lactate utilization protein LutB
MRGENKTWLGEKLGEKCVTNLKKHGFDAHFAASAQDARQIISDMTADHDTFGFGGSDTTRSLGILDDLKAQGKTIFDHLEEGLSFEEAFGNRKSQMACDCFLCSANAVSLTGELVNVDGIGNRTNAMTFGPKKVIVVAGMNKVALNLESAIRRVQEVAAPIRAKDLNMETPCAETGVCNDCNVPQRICNITLILHRKPMLTDISVVLVNDALGY